MMAREFKDSGIEWIGRIPKEWKTYRIKYNTFLKGRIGWQGLNSNDFIDEGYCLITGTDFDNKGGINWNSCYRISKERFDEDVLLHVKNGDLLMTKDGTIGKMAYIENLPEEASLNSHLLIIRQTTNIMNNKFLYWIMVSDVFTRFYNIFQSGTTMNSISQSTIGLFSTPCPSLPEQQRIADYLDKKCGEIDELIALQEQMIVQLTDYKQSVITEAVTKGLNPDAELVPSGIDWIGDVPKGWKVNKVNRMFGIIGSGTTPNSSDDDAYMGTINWLQSGDINGGILTKANKRISEETLAKYSALSIFKAPFIIVAMYGASVGNISISHIDACVNQACCVLGDSTIDFTYAFYAIKSSQRYLIYRAVGGGQPNISQYTLRQLWVPEPPLSEQQSIATYLDTKCSEIDSLIAIKQQKIETLKDYKKSVIYEAVTGKMTV